MSWKTHSNSFNPKLCLCSGRFSQEKWLFRETQGSPAQKQRDAGEENPRDHATRTSQHKVRHANKAIHHCYTVLNFEPSFSGFTAWYIRVLFFLVNELFFIPHSMKRAASLSYLNSNGDENNSFQVRWFRAAIVWARGVFWFVLKE